MMRVAATVPSFSGTMVCEDFVRSRSRSWQTHLERISSFLFVGRVCGGRKWVVPTDLLMEMGMLTLVSKGHDCFIFARLRWVTYRQPEKKSWLGEADQ